MSLQVSVHVQTSPILALPPRRRPVHRHLALTRREATRSPSGRQQAAERSRGGWQPRPRQPRAGRRRRCAPAMTGSGMPRLAALHHAAHKGDLAETRALLAAVGAPARPALAAALRPGV